MDKRNFLIKLRKSLRHTFPKKEIADILSDYESFFISGTADGKSEEEICIELGDPAVIALDLKKELPNKSLSLKYILPKVCAAALTIFGFSYQYHEDININYNLMSNSIVMFLVFAIVMCFTFYGKRNISSIGKTDKIIFSAGHITLLFISVAVFNFIFGLCKFIGKRMDSDRNFEPENITDQFFLNIVNWINTSERLGNFLLSIITASVVIAVITSIISAIRFYRSTPYYFTVIVHAAGAINLIGRTIYILRYMNDTTYFNMQMESALNFYFISIVITLIFTFIIFILSGRGKSNGRSIQKRNP